MSDISIYEVPVGWKKFFWGEEYNHCICHCDGFWWEAPNGETFCGTCYPDPETAEKLSLEKERICLANM